MAFCSMCGKELLEDANFCPNCGVKTLKGDTVGAPDPWNDLKVVFSRIGEEIDKAFTVAGKEMEKAFKFARDAIKEATNHETVTCSHCGRRNIGDAHFCYNCGVKFDK